MSLIMEQIKPDHPELFDLEFGKIAVTDFVYTLASTNTNDLPISIKLGQNVCEHKILDESYYGFNQTRTLSYLPLNLPKFLNLTLFTL